MLGPCKEGCVWWESNLLSASSLSEHPVADFQPSLTQASQALTLSLGSPLGTAWALGLVGPPMEALFRAGKSCLSS